MVQGTASSVGKSVLVAGLCRLFRQEGINVAPFKAQNMSLNSFATPDGREIGRAQAVQAAAAGLPPTADMNPILLKPEGHTRSQVVVNGRVWGTLSASEYQRRKEEFWPIVETSLSRLLASFDLVVIEGAGSPVEVNLKAHDLVNMRVARAANAPVLLVADIDRGGVFAALVGTMALLDPVEHALVAGFIVNKFRGDPELFRSGVRFLEQRLARPVLGVVPWIEGIGLAEEDSQSLDERPRAGRPSEPFILDVAVIRCPHIANFDDFDALSARSGVRVRYVDRPETLGVPDLLILPGTKTTRADLAFLKKTGLDRCILAHVRASGAVLGICGGYQMLGTRLDDPDGIEGSPGSAAGLGLLPAVTRFVREKATVQVQGQVESSSGLLARALGQRVSAYEIHMGHTETTGPAVFRLDEQGAGLEERGASLTDGETSADGWIVGTYLHGLFANVDLLEAMLGALAQRKGVALPARREVADPYDHLAGVLRQSIDVDRLLQIAGI